MHINVKLLGYIHLLMLSISPFAKIYTRIVVDVYGDFKLFTDHSFGKNYLFYYQKKQICCARKYLLFFPIFII